MPGVSGVTVVTNARVFYTTRAAAGASGARHSLRPLMSEGEMFKAKLAHTCGEIAELCLTSLRGAKRRSNPFLLCCTMDCFASLAMTIANRVSYLIFESVAAFRLSSSAKADDPVFQNGCDEIEKPRRTGYAAFAGYDDRSRWGPLRAQGRRCWSGSQWRLTTNMAAAQARGANVRSGGRSPAW
jgi:hypothetical protein